MKQYFKNIAIISVLWVIALSAWADGTVKTYTLLNGNAPTASPGTVSSSVSGTTCTLTITPANGYYLKSVTAVRTIDGKTAQARVKVPGVDDGSITVTPATDNPADLSQASKFTLTMPGSPYDVEVTADFGNRTSISGATITLTPATYTYDGTAKEPTVTVQSADGTNLTANTHYTTAYSNNTDVPATANSPQPTVTITGINNYTGTASKTFDITPNSAALTVTPATTSYVYDGTAKTPNVTVKSGNTTLQLTTDYTVTYSNNTDAGQATITVTGVGNFAGAKGTATFDISQANASIDYTITSINKQDNDASFTNNLSNTGDGTVTYTSSDTNVATINALTGEVTIVGAGATTITATVADGTNYTYTTKTATYTITVTATIKRYDLWIGDTQVTEDNQDNVLGNTGDPTFQYFPELNKLFITNNTTAVKIENRMNAGLIIYLAPNSENTITQIISTTSAPLTITTDGNNPGRLSLKTDNGNVIEGFSELNLEENLCILDADDIYYAKNTLATNTATIGIVIEPILEEKVESFENSNWYQNPDGTENTLENFIYDNKVLITLKNTQDPDGDGADDGGIVLNNEMMDCIVGNLNIKDNPPGSANYAYNFTGITLLVPAGEGWIVIDGETHDGYRIKLRSLFGEDLNEEMISENRTKRAFFYKFDVPTFVVIYNGGTGAAARNKIVRPSKKTVTHIKIFNVTVSPSKVTSSNPALLASDGKYKGAVPTIGQDENNPTEIESGIKDVKYNVVKSSDRWFNLNGQQIDEPNKKGLYIHDGKLRIKR